MTFQFFLISENGNILIHTIILSKVKKTENDHEAGGEQHPGHDVNLLGLELELFQPVDEVLLSLLQTQVGGDTQLRTSVPRYSSNERILKAISVRVFSRSQY